MSTSSISAANLPEISSTGGLTSSSTLTNEGAGGTLQITGLASGINTTELIQAELAEQELPLTNMEDEITGLGTEDSTLSSIQNSLQLVSLDAQLLGEPSLFFPTQTITSTNAALVSAATTSGVGAVVGSSTVAVSQLASAAQRTFNYTTPTAADTLTIDGQQLQLTSGESASDIADAINNSDTLDVWATSQTNSSGQEQLVLSSRATGENDNGAGSYINVQDGSTQVSGTGTYGQSGYAAGGVGAVLSEDAALSQDGADAQYTVNGVADSSASDIVSNALPGVTLTLSGVTSSTDPVTVTTAAPSADSSSIVSQVQQFVSDYNTAVSAIEGDINTAPASESDSTDYDPNSGSLFGDVDLEDFLSEMRNSIYTAGAGLPSGTAALSDLGITTGASNGTLSSTSVDGELSVDTTTLEQAIASNPNGVQAVLQSWSQSFQSLVNGEAIPGGDLAERVSGNTSLVSNLSTQYSSMMTLYDQEESSMEEQWAQVESTLEDLDNQKTSLTSFSDALTSSDSSS